MKIGLAPPICNHLLTNIYITLEIEGTHVRGESVIDGKTRDKRMYTPSVTHFSSLFPLLNIPQSMFALTNQCIFKGSLFFCNVSMKQAAKNSKSNHRIGHP